MKGSQLTSKLKTAPQILRVIFKTMLVRIAYTFIDIGGGQSGMTNLCFQRVLHGVVCSEPFRDFKLHS